MSGFKSLIHEIHRRSVWQVLGIYAVASWVVLQVVEVLTESAGLPDWTPGFAIVLLLIGLPVCLATAVVQEGLPGSASPTETREGGGANQKRDARVAGPSAPAPTDAASRPAPGGSQPDKGAPPSSRPAAHHRLFTWRNAMLGGIGAFALLGLAVFAYFLMWSTGVGPVGSLVAQGVLDERDPVVLADFGDATGHGLGDVVTEALRVDLVESPVLALVPPSRVDEVLALMGRGDQEQLTPELAREVAVREGFKAVIQGEIASAGTAYVISASVVGAESGHVLKAFRETARSDDEVVDAIDRVSHKIREGTGESLRTIRQGAPLERATTGSLEALQKLTEAERAEERGDYRTALGLLEEAIALDPGFAMAHRKIAVLHFNQGTDPARAREAATRAYENRDRLTERERYLAEAYYHNLVSRDEDARILAYRNALRVDPDDGAALNNLALALIDRGEYEEAAELLARAVSGPGESSVAHSNSVRVALHQRDVAAARVALERYRERYPTHLYVSWFSLLVAVHEGDPDSVHAAGRALAADQRSPAFIRAFMGRLVPSYDVSRGRIDEAKRHLRELAELADRLDLRGHALERTLEALHLDRELAGRHTGGDGVITALDRWRFDDIPAEDRPWFAAVVELARAGRPDLAADLYGRWEAELPERVRPPEFDRSRLEALAQIRGSERAHEQALELLNDLQRDRRCDVCVARRSAEELERLGRLEEAAVRWERVRDQPVDLAFWLGDRTVAMMRLGPLYEELGDSARAAEAYAAFAEAWADADPNLQPRVAHAREQAEALAGTAGAGGPR